MPLFAHSFLSSVSLQYSENLSTTSKRFETSNISGFEQLEHCEKLLIKGVSVSLGEGVV